MAVLTHIPTARTNACLIFLSMKKLKLKFKKFIHAIFLSYKLLMGEEEQTLIFMDRLIVSVS